MPSSSRSPRCNQAFRLGEAAWGIQFHAEVTLETIHSWLADEDELPGDVDRDALGAETEARIGEWTRLGRELCNGLRRSRRPRGRSRLAR